MSVSTAPRVVRRPQRIDRARQCGSKVGYLSETLAANMAVLLGWIGQQDLSVYACPHCSDWHIGRRNKRVER